MPEGNIEITNKGMRFAHRIEQKITFGYEDGRKVVVSFKDAETAARHMNNRWFMNPNKGEVLFNLPDVTEVEYLAP
jgi:hypothetical protein